MIFLFRFRESGKCSNLWTASLWPALHLTIFFGISVVPNFANGASPDEFSVSGEYRYHIHSSPCAINSKGESYEACRGLASPEYNGDFAKNAQGGSNGLGTIYQCDSDDKSRKYRLSHPGLCKLNTTKRTLSQFQKEQNKKTQTERGDSSVSTNQTQTSENASDSGDITVLERDAFGNATKMQNKDASRTWVRDANGSISEQTSKNAPTQPSSGTSVDSGAGSREIGSALEKEGAAPETNNPSSDPSFRVGAAGYKNQPDNTYKPGTFGEPLAQKDAGAPGSGQTPVGGTGAGAAPGTFNTGVINCNLSDPQCAALAAQYTSNGGGGPRGSVSGTQTQAPSGYISKGDGIYEKPDGKIVRRDANGNETPVDGQWQSKNGGRFRAEEDWRNEPNDFSGPCATAEKLAKGSGKDYYDCKRTKTYATAAQVTNQLSMVGGQLATAGAGISAQISAQQAGTQSAALRGAADTQATSAKIEMTTGAVNTAMGVLNFWRAFQHGEHAEDIQKDTKGQQLQNEKTAKDGGDATGGGTTRGEDGYLVGNGLAGNAVEKFRLNDKGALQTSITRPEGTKDYELQREIRNKEIKSKQNKLSGMVGEIGAKSASEHEAVQSQASGVGFMSLVTGVQQSANGMLHLAGANQLKQAADKLANAERLSAAVAPPKFDGSFAPLNNDAAARGVNGVLGSTAQAAAADA
ncbi:MAG: hypothetical protein AABZ55_02350, partial [Bdellovibrionota bacterium]